VVTSAPLVRLRSNRRATPTTRVIQVDVSGRPMPFTAGQWMRLGRPADENPRPYSVASSPEESHALGVLEFLVRDEGSGAGVAGLRSGALVRLEGPHGRFHLPEPFTEGDALFVAGGTGIAPLRSMLMHALRQPRHPRCAVLYSARSTVEFAYRGQLRRLAAAGRITLALTVTGTVRGRWRGARGRITHAQLAGMRPTASTQCFVCGPPGFVSDVRLALAELGVSRVRSEEQ
jgi:NAD(P)H-flavin reductase